MSGFVALLHGDGRPIRGDSFTALVNAMRYRGPDRIGVQCAGDTAFGHADFVTAHDREQVPQPLLFEGRLWVVADARLDDRARLIRALSRDVDPPAENAPDAVLLARAYDAWGEAMVDHLLGDFAFAVWDVRRRRLFCARDHMGVKPFYFAPTGSDLVVGNTLASLRAHPGVSDRLDEHAIGDYLLFGLNRHAERTSFADIARLPPAHTMTWTPGSPPRMARYWQLQTSEGAADSAHSEAERLERFTDVLQRAAADRVTDHQAAVLMSGGLDSTAVAALVHDVMERRYGDPRLHACTFTYERLADDPEPHMAALVASRLAIDHHILSLDGDGDDDFWGPDAAWSAEPNEFPASARMVRKVSRAAPGVRVGFTGQGGDPALHITPADAAHRARRDGWSRTAGKLALHRWRDGKLLRIGLRTHVRRKLRGRRYEFEPFFPPWFRPELEERLGLRLRHDEFFARDLNAAASRPEAAFQLDGPEWSFFLESYDPGMTGFLAEYRHPLLDIRVLELAMGLPMIPWLAEKEMLRRCMKGRLPAAVIARRKTPVAGFPVHESLLRDAAANSGLAASSERLAEFIDVRRLESIVARPERLRPSEYQLLSRPLGLAFWLSRLEAGVPGATEIHNDTGPQDGKG